MNRRYEDMQQAIEYNIKGIKCDNIECSYQDMEAEFDPEKYLNMPCPLCGCNLFTQADYDVLKKMLGVAETINETFKVPENDRRVAVEVEVEVEVKMNFPSVEAGKILDERVKAILSDNFCKDDHDRYEACLTCERESHKIIGEMYTVIKDSTEALNSSIKFVEDKSKRLNKIRTILSDFYGDRNKLTAGEVLYQIMGVFK